MSQAKSDLIYEVVSNKDMSSAQKLIDFKSLISKALPNMQKTHIIRLLFDKRHCSLLLWQNNEIVGGTCFACFPQQGFTELSFLAVKSDKRIQGYGKKIMNKTKTLVQAQGIGYIITYGDNMALGFFRKQGFSQKITIDENLWKGFIKEYDGGKLMECKIHNSVDYMKIDEIIQMQKNYVRKMVINACSNGVRFETKKVEHRFQEEESDKDATQKVFKRDPRKIPGVVEAGWKWQEHEKLSKYEIQPFNVRCIKLIEAIKRHPQSKYFLDPVSQSQVPAYSQVIKNPIHLSAISEKISKNIYESESDLCEDIELIFKNCCKFNSSDSIFYKSANRLRSIIKPEIDAFKNKMISTDENSVSEFAK